ncbi:MAG: hypothetical protein JWN52_5132 [Actinomycetia bacterium]|jgi:hypothetical protein|nr:hypothetical protein [Actinomycetes bacterium]
MIRRIAPYVAAIMAAAALVVTAQSPAGAAPVRTNSKSEAVYFIHGSDVMHTKVGGAGDNCKSTWNTAMSSLRSRGWTGEFTTWGYYKNDTNCTRKVDGNLNTRIQELGRLLAWDIYTHYSSSGKSVDVVAHSMGGLVIRAAITGTRRYGGKADHTWPPYLYVEDVATLSTPFSGNQLATACTVAYGWKQCSDMRPGSGFLSWAGQNPQSNQGTDWTLIGASDDGTVSSGAAIGMNATHKAIYAAGQGLKHSKLPHAGAGGTWKLKYSNNNGSSWTSTSAGPGPLKLVGNALYYWSAS